MFINTSHNLPLDAFGNRIFCSVNKILKLAQRKCSFPLCDSFYKVSYKPSGCAIIVSGICDNGHKFEWTSSESSVNQSEHTLYRDNLSFATALVLSGNNFSKIALFCKFYGVKVISKSTFYAYQRQYICAAVHHFYTTKQVIYQM